jgi:hypothetical protein
MFTIRGPVRHQRCRQRRPPTSADLDGGFRPPDDGNADIDNIGHGASGVRPDLTLPAYDDLPPTTELPATSAINQVVPPWQNPPVAYTTTFTQQQCAHPPQRARRASTFTDSTARRVRPRLPAKALILRLARDAAHAGQTPLRSSPARARL